MQTYQTKTQTLVDKIISTYVICPTKFDFISVLELEQLEIPMSGLEISFLWEIIDKSFEQGIDNGY